MANYEELFSSEDIDLNHRFSMMNLHSKAFTCPHCKGLASHLWHWGLMHDYLYEDNVTVNNLTGISIVINAACQACDQVSIWLKDLIVIEQNAVQGEEFMIYPEEDDAKVTASPDMPETVKQIFMEASAILKNSPRASAALARLAIDLLTKELGAEGKNLNARIGDLVSKGLPLQIQQALDSIRVTGNNAVHPGEIDFADNIEMAESLLKFINIIVENQITQPLMIKRAYSSLPDGALKSIERRDGSRE